MSSDSRQARTSLSEEARTAQQLFDLPAAGAQFIGGAEQIASLDRIPVAAAAIIQTGDIERLDGAPDLLLQLGSLLRLQVRSHAVEAGAQSRAENRMIVHQECPRQGWAAQPARCFGEARRREIEQR